MSLTQGLQLPFGIQPVNPVPVDSWSGPYDGVSLQATIDLANSTIPIEIRFQSMEVRLIVDGIAKKFWYRDGVNNTDLIEFGLGPIGVTGATGPAGNTGVTGFGVTSSFYLQGTTDYSYDTTSAIYRTGSLNIGTGTASNSRFVVSSSGGTVSLVVDESGNIYNGDLTSLKLGYNSLNNLGGFVPELSFFYDIDNGSGYTDGTYSVTTSLYSGTPLTEYPVIVVNVSGGLAYIQEVLSTGSGWVDEGFSTILTATIPGGSGYQVQIIIYLTATTDQYNTAIGNNSLYSNTTGAYNTSIGNNSLYSNKEGVYNSALGVQSLYSNTTGANNIAISYQSLYSNTTGISNIALGVQSLYSNTTGINNIAVGMYSSHNTTGSYNTVIGYQSLFYNIMGAYNIAIGDSACTLTNSLTTNSATSSYNSIFIGSNTKPQLSNQTNQIVIGHGAYGYGSNSATLGNDDIIKTILKGNIGIGTASPSTKLHVYSTQSGAFRLEDGTQGVGKVLISDINGIASWASFSSTGGVTGPAGATGFGTTSSFYLQGTNEYSYDTTSAIYRTGSINIGTGSVTTYTYGPLSLPVDGRFTVSSSSGTVSLVIDESGNIFNNSINGNTKFGFQALNSATSSLMIFGQSCVAIGDRALYSCTSGSQNIAIGSSALNSNTTGYQNIAIGINTLSQNMIGYNNVALGNNTLVYNTGDYNIALGNSALSRNTTGYYNIALGVQSGSIISGTGDINTGTGATNSNSSIFIGYFTSPSASGNTNEIVIGHDADGNGSNTITLGNNSVTRTYLKGSVVIADGTQGVDKILTSDANGVASWTSKPYKSFVALITQSGTASPTLVSLENTLEQTVTATRSNTGRYALLVSGSILLATKTWWTITNDNNNGFIFYMNKENSFGNTNTVYIDTSVIGGTYTDGVLQSTPIEIRVYN